MAKPHLNLVWFLICSLIATKPFGTYGFNIKLIPMDRFDKRLFPENLTLEERYQRISDISRARLRQLELSMASSSSMEWKESTGHDPNALKPTVSKHPIMGYYVTSLMVGTPSYFPNLIVDTACDDTWTQCEGCTTCFPLRQGNFDRNKSLAYRPLPCEHPLCVPRICINGSCAYDTTYLGIEGHATYSRGQVGLDTFIFQDGNRSVKGFPKTVFGCGLDNHNMPWRRLGENNTVSGVFGLGWGRRSILMQYAHETKGRISYCLPSSYARGGTYTLLNFGDDARIGGHPGSIVQTTALISNVSKYMVNVLGISINQKRLNINPAVFRLRPDRTGGFGLDSGCPHSVLVQIAYDAVKAEITQYFSSKYSWHPEPPQPGNLDLCYSLPRGNYTYPTMTYHFSGANLFLPAENVFKFIERGFCLIVIPTRNEGLNVLGAFQQANYRFLFDFVRLRASFVPEVCGVN